MEILLVDDEELSRQAIATFLEGHLGHKVEECENGTDALAKFQAGEYHMVLTDIRMPGIDGLDLLRQLKALSKGRWVDVVMMTGYADIHTSVNALRGGAYDYLRKPIDVEELSEVVDRIAEHQMLIRENYELKHAFNEKIDEVTKETKTQLEQLRSAYAEIVGIGRIGVFSDAMKSVIAMAHRLHEDRTVPVLIHGETGTGKEVIARIVHYGEEKVTAPFISINCSALAPTLFESELFGYEGGAFTGARKTGMEGKFEAAQGGTLFLDEIGELPLDLQPKLLRALQEREIYRVGGVRKVELDVRIICATNQDLEQLVEDRKFRRDLFYRLNMGNITLPPLRERTGAIGPLSQMFLEKFSEQKKRSFQYISKESLAILEQHQWPGNVRELQNAIERVVLLYDEAVVQPSHLQFLTSKLPVDDALDEEKPAQVTIGLPPDKHSLKLIEQQVVQYVVDMHKGNKSHAADYLGITRTTLRNILNR